MNNVLGSSALGLTSWARQLADDSVKLERMRAEIHCLLSDRHKADAIQNAIVKRATEYAVGSSHIAPMQAIEMLNSDVRSTVARGDSIGGDVSAFVDAIAGKTYARFETRHVIQNDN